MAYTADASDITQTSATLNGVVYDDPPSNPPVTYHFEYGTTTAYGTSSPDVGASGCFQCHASYVASGLAHGTTYHFRVVAGDSAGDDATFATSSPPPEFPPPPGPGTTRTAKTVGPGGSISTGSNPSKSNPIVVSVKAETGGKLIVDEIANPDRPGDAVSCDDSGGAEGCVEDNPEDETPKDKHWYGPAIRMYMPDAGGGKAPRQVITVVFRIDGATDMRETPHPEIQHVIDGFNGSHSGACFPGKVGSARHLPNGDTEIINYFKCNATGPLTFQFYNQGWGGIGRESFGSYAQSLNDELDNGRLSFGFACNLKCSKTITASIAQKSAKALGLKSNVIGSVHTEPGEDYNGVPLSAKVRKALRKITRKGGRLTILFEAKAVGPGGQVVKKHQTVRLKADAEENDF
jgi:hypothetical protein